MRFDPRDYGEEVQAILELDGGGNRLMPLASGQCSSEEARRRLAAADPKRLFPGAPAPEAAVAGLWLYFSCLDESHRVSQEVPTAEGSFWHGIMHRQEPDPGNSGYWFRQVGTHPLFTPLNEEAAALAAKYPNAGFRTGPAWDPFAFIDFVESARRAPGSDAEKLALEIQRAEWHLLFDFCARPRG